jgi:hypothetical protein
MKSLESRYRFFREHGGFIVGESAVSAIHLARAEESAETLGLVCYWEPDPEPWDGASEAPMLLLWGAVYRSGQLDHAENVKRGEIGLASIMVSVDSYRDPYLRVYAAELFAEALDVLDDEDQAEADKLAKRATFAAGAIQGRNHAHH